MGEAPHYQADLARESLAELLLKVYNYRVPGLAEAQRDGVTKRLFVRDGNVIFATSTDRKDSLGEHLLRTGALGHDELRAVATEHERTKERVGELLLRRGLLSPRQLNEAIRTQIEQIAWSLFSWHNGQVKFELREQQERNQVRIQISLRHMVFHGLSENCDVAVASRRLGGSEARYEPSWTGDELIDIGLDQGEFALLRLADGSRTVDQLLRLGPFDHERNLRLLHAFHVMRLVRDAADKTTGVRIRLQTAGARFS